MGRQTTIESDITFSTPHTDTHIHTKQAQGNGFGSIFRKETMSVASVINENCR